MDRKNISSGAKWEDIVGYSRAVCIGNQIFVAGTTATNSEGQIVGKDDVYQQTKQILQNIEHALEKAGANIQHVVRTRMYVIDINQWQEIGRAHGEYFSKIKPASTMIEVSRLVDPDMLVEIEVDAVIN